MSGDRLSCRVPLVRQTSKLSIPSHAESVEDNSLLEDNQAPIFAVSETVKEAEAASVNLHSTLNSQSAPIRQYLESSVVPTLMQGLQALVKERPENPVEFLAHYLLTNNPQKKT